LKLLLQAPDRSQSIIQRAGRSGRAGTRWLPDWQSGTHQRVAPQYLSSFRSNQLPIIHTSAPDKQVADHNGFAGERLTFCDFHIWVPFYYLKQLDFLSELQIPE
jgi:hypothetical protein